MLYPPGTGWNYSHTNFVVLGMAPEKIGGGPMNELMQDNLLRVAGLRNTKYPLTPKIQPPVLHAFTSERGIYEDSTYWNPSWTSFTGLLTSDIRDVGKWAGLLGAGTLVSKRSYQAMPAPTAGRGPMTRHFYFGLGVIVMNSWLVQNVRFGGYNVVMADLPPQKIAIAIATTQSAQNSPDANYGVIILKEIVKELAPKNPIPDRYK